MHFQILVGLLLPYVATCQTLQCSLLAGGCDGGTSHNAAVEGAIARFSVDQIYGGRLDTFSTFLDGDYLAQISYSCLDRSVPPALSGLTTQNLLNQLLNCPNQCGSVSLPGNSNCGFASLIADVANVGGCFSNAENLVPESGSPSELASSGTFQSLGCWTDSTSARALTGGSSTASDMSVEKCVGLASGYRYAGVEYSTECYWGNTIQATSTQSAGSCNMPCSGSPPELCGGGNLINIYEDSSLAPIPSIVPSVGSFDNAGCYVDTASSRLLVADSLVDYSTTGMTVEKCVAFAKNGSYQYAGVEYYGECYVGNTLHGTNQAADSDCSTVCSGNSGEFCGGANRMQIYQDSTYTDPTLADLIAIFSTYQSALSQVQGCIKNYQTVLQNWQSEGGSLARRSIAGRQGGAPGSSTAAAQEIEDGLADCQSCIETSEPALEQSISDVETASSRASSSDRSGSPLLDEDTASLAESLQEPLQEIQFTRQGISSDYQSFISFVTNTGSEAPLLGEDGGAAAAAASLNLIGESPDVVGASLVGGIGILLIVATILERLNPPPPNQQPTPVPTPTATSAASSSTSSSCSPTLTPTPMVVLAAQDISDTNYSALIQLIPKQNLVEEISYPGIGFRAFLADLDDCLAETLEDQSNVLSVSLNAVVPDTVATEDSFDAVSKRAETGNFLPNQNKINISEIRPRVVSANTDIMLQYPSPFHLQWLSATWAKSATNLPGTYFNIPGYLYDKRPTPEPVWVYVLDTGVDASNPDFFDNGSENGTSRIETQFNARTGLTDPTDIDGHGTRMASAAAGTFSGVSKDASIVSIKVIRFGDKKNSTVWDYAKGIAFACNHVHANSRQGRAVFSMSWGVNMADLDWQPTPQRVKASHNPFGWLFGVFIFPGGIVAAAASSNKPTDDMYLQEPTARGADADGQGLIVVGNAGWTGARWPASSILDSSPGGNILSIYANGVQVCSATNFVDSYQCGTGTSPATAQVAGLAAYYLADTTTRNALIQQLPPGRGLNNLDWSSFSLKMKNYLVTIGTQEKGLGWGDNIPRAAMNEEYDCPPPETATIAAPPIYIEPGSSETPWTETYPLLTGPNPDNPGNRQDTVPYLGKALRDASVGMVRYLDGDQDYFGGIPFVCASVPP